MANDPASNAHALRSIADALNKWGKLPETDSPETREAARTVLGLTTRYLNIVMEASNAWGCHQSVKTALEWLRTAAAEAGRTDLGGYWSWWHELAQRHLPGNVSLADELERWAAELEKVRLEAKGGKKRRQRAADLPASTKEYDAFLCHASEDKDAAVRPFAQLMQEHGMKPWLDEGEVVWGDTLVKKIQDGLVRSRFVVVFLSNDFLRKKNWTETELNTALSMEIGGKSFVLPVLLGITHEELQAKYPLVSAKFYKVIPDYDPARPVPAERLRALVEELKLRIGRG